MDDWVLAIYDATGIPLDEGDLALAFVEAQWWLMLHRVPVLPVGDDPDPASVTASIRPALSSAMAERLSHNGPRVRRVLESMSADRAGEVAIEVVHSDGVDAQFVEGTEPERGWPHFRLRLSAGGFDVEVDLDPLVPDDPFDAEDLRRQAAVILQVLGSR